MISRRRLTAYVAILLFATLAGRASAQQRLTCNSDDMRRHHCRAYTGAGVTLVRQHSRAECKRGATWGTDESGIWVDRGCRAEFEVGRYPNLGGPAGGAPAVLTCSSDDWRRHICPADTTGGVRLRKQLSQAGCWLDETWGFDARGIWVDNGCRGEFEVGQSSYYSASGQSNQPGANSRATSQSNNTDTGMVAGAVAAAVLIAMMGGRHNDNSNNNVVTCSSPDNLFHSCDTGPNKGVQFKKRLSAGTCKLNQSWGYDDQSIWVDRGCSAEFVVKR